MMDAPDIAVTAAAIVLSYVLGSIPTGLWMGKAWRGIDIREHGSQNIGATNTLRVLGKKFGAVALAGDVLKGMIAVLALGAFSAWPYAPLACGGAAIAGHTWSVFLRLHGGKGVATSAGVLLALIPVSTAAGLAVFTLVAYLSRMVSAGSITAAAVIGALVLILERDPLTHLEHDFIIRGMVLLMVAVVIIRHRTNIQRIMRGEEHKF
ncbi:MAG: glycerol-3-phosphate 1-O-acyltransferase PlsY [Candidatus Hydrogenedentota bacterium]